jgi:hypothetical protein
MRNLLARGHNDGIWTWRVKYIDEDPNFSRAEHHDQPISPFDVKSSLHKHDHKLDMFFLKEVNLTCWELLDV